MVTTATEPLQVTSHGFVVGVWYPDGTEPLVETGGTLSRSTQELRLESPILAAPVRLEFRPAPKVKPRA